MDRFDHYQLLQQRKKRSSKSYGGEGDGRIEKRISASGRQLDSSFSVGLSTEDNLLNFDFGRSSSNQTIGAPMKMLLAEEMSKESRRRSPSVITRLMGLDPLPTQQPVDKQQKKFSESFLQGKKPTGFQEKYVSYENGSLWKSSKEQPEFKDVFEVVDTSMVEKRNIRTARNGRSSSRPSEAKMALIRQKFMDAKRLSTHENLWQSKDFHDALEVLDSNKDLFQKFLHEPDSLFQPVPSAPQPNRVTGLKSSKFTKHETRDLCWKSDKRMERQMQMRSDNQKHECGCVSHNIDDVNLSQKSTRLEGKTGSCLLPTRIVVLRPSLGREQSAARAVSSSSSSTSSRASNRRYRDFWRSGNRELFPEVRDRPKLVNDVDLLRYRTKTSREIAREITQQMRQSLSSGSPNLSYLGQGYAGDESSYCTSGKDSVTDNEASTQTSKHYYERSKRYVPSSSNSTESSVSREARKRLSERWKMTNRLQEVGPVGRGGSSTLGEMLAMSDREGAVAASASTIDRVGSGNSSSGVDVLEICECPSGISSRDGWKDAFPRHLPRSKSLPASSTVYGSEKTSRCDAACNDNQCMLKEGVNHGHNNYVKENSDQKGSSCPEHSKLSGKNSRSYLHEDEEIMDTICETYVSPEETKNIVESRDLSEQLIVAEPSSGCIGDPVPLTDDVMVPECEDKMDSKTDELPLPEPTTCKMLVKDGDLADGYQNDLIIEKTSLDQPQEETHSQVTEMESPHSSKGAEQPSPVSVLEPPFEVETSGSECFQKVSADLHGLRMQLQLLKLETVEAYTEGSDFVVSSDEDFGERCDSVMQDRQEHSALRDLESRDFSFLLDVLVDSGFHDVAYPEILFATWHSPELPIGPGVFEMLEKKYGGQFMWPRSERRLLFDCINLALAEILKQDQYPWIKLKGRRVATMLADSGALADKVWELVVLHGKEGCGDTPEKVLGRDFQWLELGDDTKAIGTEIERLLMDELMEELLCGLSSGRVL